MWKYTRLISKNFLRTNNRQFLIIKTHTLNWHCFTTKERDFNIVEIKEFIFVQTKILRKSFRDEKTLIMTLRYSINFSHYSFFQLLKRKDYWSSHQIIDIPTFYIMGKTILNPIKLELHIAVHGSSKAAVLWVTTVKANI